MISCDKKRIEMAMFPELNKKEIYPIAGKGGDYLVYSPLSGDVLMADGEAVARLETCAAGADGDNDARELVAHLISGRSQHRNIPKRRMIGDIHKMSILPNYSCNFRCGYCYSSEGRSSKCLEKEKALAAIDFFIDRERTPLHNLWLAILGGGEPLLFPEYVGEIIEYAVCRAKGSGFNLGVGLTTNGSIFDEGLAEILVRNGVGLGVSFEVLEDVQNSQRQDHDKVCRVIDRYLEYGVDVSVKSIITPLNVHRLTEMADALLDNFPDVKSYKLQIVEDVDMFADVEAMRSFYDTFTEEFFKARAVGEDHGIDVYVLAFKYLDMLVEHYCGGEICVTPEGTLSVCHRVSSPAEKDYGDFVYGRITDGLTVEVDADKLSKLLAHNTDTDERCLRCFAKWHCGGGCLAQACTYDREHLEVICEWTRDFTTRLLLGRLKNMQE